MRDELTPEQALRVISRLVETKNKVESPTASGKGRKKNGFEAEIEVLRPKTYLVAPPVDPLVADFERALKGGAPSRAEEDLSGTLEGLSEELAASLEEIAQASLLKKAEREFESEVDRQALEYLEDLKKLTLVSDFLRLGPSVRTYTSEKLTRQFVLLGSITFPHGGDIIVRNCTVDDEVIKPKHHLCIRHYNKDEGIIRSFRPAKGKSERWVKAVEYKEGMLLRYFTTHNGATMDFAQYSVLKDGAFSSLTKDQYEEALKARKSLDQLFSFVPCRGAHPDGGAPAFV